MFDIWHVAAHALWIFGLAVLLAVWSFGYYEAQQTGEPISVFFSRPNYGLAITLGLILFLAGLAAVDGRLWAKAIWGVLALIIIGLQIYRRR
ncbi:MAG: hypothetical protein WAM60_00045 [Candidatus Promineifilaceae bacterium]